ncbi:hypothetical protein Tco_0338851, partial [Tanacetum coccineum]
STPSPRAFNKHSFNSPDVPKPSQPSFPHLVDYRIDTQFYSEYSVGYHVYHGLTGSPPQHSQFCHFHPIRLGFRDRPAL